MILRTRRRFAAAAAAHRKALELAPDDPGILGNLGNALKDDGRFEEAIAIKRRVIELAGARTPRPCTAWASPCATPGELDAGRRGLRPGAGAEAGRPGDPLQPGADPAASRATFATGWGHYEARWQLERQKKRDFPQPWWHGEPFAGKTLLLFAEQGFGDTIQFIRFAPAGEGPGRHGWCWNASPS